LLRFEDFRGTSAIRFSEFLFLTQAGWSCGRRDAIADPGQNGSQGDTKELHFWVLTYLLQQKKNKVLRKRSGKGLDVHCYFSWEAAKVMNGGTRRYEGLPRWQSF
jgi:hypothetical protein